MSLVSASRHHSQSVLKEPKEPKFVSIASDFEQPAQARNRTAVFVSTFRAKEGCEPLMRHELQRLVTATRRESDCLFCDLFRLSSDEKVFVVHTVWARPEGWLQRKGWEGHPAGIGLLDLCLLEPIDVVQMEEVA